MHRLLITRHGESEWNAIGRWQGQADPPLSDLGRRQAQAAASRLGPLDAIFASDLQRAHQTAMIISESLGQGPVIVDPDLRERDAGEWSGLTKDEVEAAWPGYLDSHRRPPAFEPDDSFLERILRALGRIREQVDDGEVLVLCHGGVIYALERHLNADAGRIANLGSRWVLDHGDRLELGERIDLVDPEELTVPGQL